MMNEPKSILRNKQEQSPQTSAKFDRNKVLENTLINSKLNDVGQTIKEHPPQPQHDDNAGIKWDEANIYLSEQEKSSTMKIDEPKTPFQGAVGDSEYYLPDEEEEELIGQEFSLGEPEIDAKYDATIQNNRIEKTIEEKEEQEEQEPEPSAEERHRRFDEMRKKHYQMKGAILKRPVEDDDKGA